MIYFFDNELNMIKVTTSKNVISAVHEHELNGLILGTVETDLSYTEAFINDVDYFGYYYKDNYYLHKIKRVEHEHENELVRITGRHIFFEDMLYGDYIRDVRPENRDALYILNRTISTNTRWQTVMTDTSKVHTETYYWVPPMEVLNDLTENVGIEYEPKILFDGQNINGFQLHVANRIGEDTPIRVPFGSRVLNLKYEVDYSEIVTALYGHGKGEEVGDGYGRRINFSSVNFSRNGVVSPSGRLYMENPNITSQYGKDDGSPKFGRIIFEDIEDEQELADATYEAYLEQSRPKMLFESSVVDLGDVGMGDGVLIIRREYDVYFNARIHKLVVDLLDAENADVELGDYAHFKESKVQRKTRESNNQYRRQTTNRIQQLKEQFNERFDDEVNHMWEEYEQALIDVHAEIEASEQRHEDKWEQHEAEIDDTIERIVGGSLDSLDTNLLDVNSRLLSKLDESDLQPLHGRIDDAFSDISDVSDELSSARESLQEQLDEAKEDTEEEITTLSESIEYIDGQLEAKLNRTEIEPIQNKITEYGTTLDANAESIGLLQDKTELHDDDITKWSNQTQSNAEEIGRTLTRLSDIDGEIEQAQTDISANADGISGLLTRVSNTESSIADVNLSVDGITADFANYKQDIDSDVGALSTQVASYEASVNGFRAEVGTLQGDINNVDSWISEKGSIIDGNADAIRARVWQQDIDAVEVGGRNLLRDSRNIRLISNNSSVYPIEVDTSGENHKFRRVLGSDNTALSTYTQSFFTAEESGTYTQSIKVKPEEDITLSVTSGGESVLCKAGEWTLLSTSYELTSGQERRAFGLYGSHDYEISNPWIEYKEWKVEKGNKATDWTPAPEDTLMKTDFILESDGFFLGGKYVGGDHYSTAIVGSRDGIDILADRMRVTGDLLVRGDVESYALSAVRGDIADLRTRILTSNVVNSDHLNVNAALANKFNANSAFISRLEVQAANIRDLTGIHIRGGLLESLNGRTSFNLDTGFLDMVNTRFRLGGGADIEFASAGNRLYYERRDGTTTRTSGLGVGTAINNRFPIVWMGTTGTTRGNFDPSDGNYFTGFISNTSGRYSSDGIQNSVVGNLFQVRDEVIGYSRGFEFSISGAIHVFRGMSTNSNDYNLGERNAPFTSLFMKGNIHAESDFAINNRTASGSIRGWRIQTDFSGNGDAIALHGLNSGNYNYQIGSRRIPAYIDYLYLRNEPRYPSDRSLKENIGDLNLGLDFINDLSLKEFSFKMTKADINQGKVANEMQFGLIAQEVVEILGKHDVDIDKYSIADYREDGILDLQYGQLIMPTIKAVQELDEKVETNAEKIVRLEKEIELLKGE